IHLHTVGCNLCKFLLHGIRRAPPAQRYMSTQFGHFNGGRESDIANTAAYNGRLIFENFLHLHYVLGRLPVAYTTIPIEGALPYLLLKRVFLHFFFVDLNTQPRPFIWFHHLPFDFYHKTFSYDLLPPWHIIMHAFANDI